MTDEAFRERVRERVEALGIGPIALAEANGLERNFIADILDRRKKSVRASSIPRLAQALKCDQTWLSSGSIPVSDQQEQALLNHWRRLPVDRRDAWLALIEATAHSAPPPPEDA